MLHLHPSSGLARASIEAPDYAVYVDLVSTARPCMRHVTAVTLQQLEERRSQVSNVLNCIPHLTLTDMIRLQLLGGNSHRLALSC
jgi:Oligonucleotide/oligosaccharide-binding (OB)-fold